MQKKLDKENPYLISNNSILSKITDGLIVKLIAALVIYLPFAVEGFALLIAATNASTFSLIASAEKETFPTAACILPFLSTLYVTCPPLASLTAFVTSIVTVPVFGFGIKPFGPRILPTLPTIPIQSGVAIKTSKLIFPAWISSAKSSFPTISAPAAFASSIFTPLAKTATLTVFPVPFGRTTAPLIIWSSCLGSTFKLSAISTLSSNLADFKSLTKLQASAKEYFLSSTFALNALYLFETFAILFSAILFFFLPLIFIKASGYTLI